MIINKPEDGKKRAITEIKVAYDRDYVAAYGRCPTCWKMVGGKLDLRQFNVRVGELKDEAKVRIIAQFLTDKHKCTGVLVKPYDGRFDSMKRDEKGKLRLPEHITDKDVRDMGFASA